MTDKGMKSFRLDTLSRNDGKIRPLIEYKENARGGSGVLKGGNNY
jgi:hypothetical protein